MNANSGPITPCGGACGALHITRCLIVGQRPWFESGAIRRLGSDPVHSEDAPVIPVNVPSKQIPAAAPDYEPLRLRPPASLLALVVDISEAQSLAGSNRSGDRAQYCRIHGRPGSGDAHGRGPHSVDSMPQP